MAHDLAHVNGHASMAYCGPTPWHGLGTRLHQPATSAEAMAAARLDYEVELCDLTTECGLPVPKRRAVVRRDTAEVLATVGAGYTPVQNREAFAFLDELAGNDEVRYHTAGALGRGEKVWMLAKLPGEIRINRTDDISHPYLLLSNSHDGRSALRIHWTAIRVVCANTLALADQHGRGQGVALRHRGDIRGRLDDTRQILGIAQRRFRTYEEQANRLANRPLNSAELDAYFEGLYPDRPDEQRGRSKAIRSRLTDLFETGRGQDLPGVRHSAWAALNAVTEYVDHHRTTRGRDARTRTEGRLNSAWFGSGAQLKQRAFEQALALAV